jgi:hypothetical protein
MNQSTIDFFLKNDSYFYNYTPLHIFDVKYGPSEIDCLNIWRKVEKVTHDTSGHRGWWDGSFRHPQWSEVSIRWPH